MKRILVIDDLHQFLHLMRMMIEEEGHQVSVLNTGHGALEFVRLQKPDVIVLDLILEDMSGLAILRELKTQRDTATIPVVVYTASVLDSQKAQQMIEQEPEIFEGTRVLLKPFSLDELMQLIL